MKCFKCGEETYGNICRSCERKEVNENMEEKLKKEKEDDNRKTI